MIQAYTVGYAAATQRAVLKSVAADVTAAHMAARQEDDLRLHRGEDETVSGQGSGH